MTEPLDLDALRLAVDGHDPAHGYLWAHGTLHLLIDELEATRAERDDLEDRLQIEGDWGVWQHEHAKAVARAERAEAERDEARDSLGCETAQRRENLRQVEEMRAAIARVEALCDDGTVWDDYVASRIRAALRGDRA